MNLESSIELSALVKINERLLMVYCNAGGSFYFLDEGLPDCLSPPDLDHGLLGQRIRAALMRCFNLSQALGNKGYDAALAKQGSKRALQYGHYKTQAALYKQMKGCIVRKKGDQLFLNAYHHEKSETGRRELSEGYENRQKLQIPWSSSDEELGAALYTLWGRLVDMHDPLSHWSPSVNVLCNERLWVVSVYSGRFVRFLDAEAPEYLLPSEVDDKTLGKSLREAFTHCRQVMLAEYDRLQRLSKEAVRQQTQRLLQYGKYKTQSALRKQMKVCEVDKVGDRVFLTAQHSENSENSARAAFLRPRQIEELTTSWERTDAELGAALRTVCGRLID